MADPRTQVLLRLLEAEDPAGRDSAWAEFVAEYSRLILHVARSVCGNHDAAMDGYAYVLEHLCGDDFSRLRAFVADGRSEFSTWLLVVAQRLCFDYQRKRYGRSRPREGRAAFAEEESQVRVRLVDLIGENVEITGIVDENGLDPERAVRVKQVHAAVESALGALSPRERLLIKLRFEDGCSDPEIAQNLELPTRWHAYRLMSETLNKMKTSLSRNGISESEP